MTRLTTGLRGLAIMSALTAAPFTARAQDSFEARYPDFACDIDKGPFAPEEAAKIDNNFLMALGKQAEGQEQIDRIYARSTAGAMPAGFYRGAIIPARSDQGEMLKKYLVAMGVPAVLANDGTLKFVGEMFWKGKIFKDDPLGVPNAPSRILANKMPATAVQGFFKAFGMTPPPEAANANEWRFPAKVYCGVSLFDARRESVVIDYAHTESVQDGDTNPATKVSYVKPVDQLAGREYLAIRDEIRMVRPGFYLGRAYMGRIFVLNFTLECVDGQCRKEAVDECDIGSQRRIASKEQCLSLPEFRKL